MAPLAERELAAAFISDFAEVLPAEGTGWWFKCSFRHAMPLFSQESHRLRYRLEEKRLKYRVYIVPSWPVLGITAGPWITVG